MPLIFTLPAREVNVNVFVNLYQDFGAYMRITAGIKRNRRLRVSKRGIRPTREMVRQAVFNILGERVYQSVVLDIFAGTGAMGIEAISRGARSVVFIEITPGILMENLRRLALEDKGRVIAGDFRPALKKLSGSKFDIIFLDPPYKKGYLTTALGLIQDRGLLRNGGMIIAEHRVNTKFEIPNGLRVVKKRRYGDTEITFIQREEIYEKGNLCRNI